MGMFLGGCIFCFLFAFLVVFFMNVHICTQSSCQISFLKLYYPSAILSFCFWFVFTFAVWLLEREK